MAESKIERVKESSGNVFADLGFGNAENELAKARLVRAISEVIRSKKLTQARVAALIGIDQPQVSRLLRGQTAGYSTDRLIRVLNLLGQDVEILIRRAADGKSAAGKLYVHVDSVPLQVAETRKGLG